MWQHLAVLAMYYIGKGREFSRTGHQSLWPSSTVLETMTLQQQGCRWRGPRERQDKRGNRFFACSNHGAWLQDQESSHVPSLHGLLRRNTWPRSLPFHSTDIQKNTESRAWRAKQERSWEITPIPTSDKSKNLNAKIYIIYKNTICAGGLLTLLYSYVPFYSNI